jgi:hypothetical protein
VSAGTYHIAIVAPSGHAATTPARMSSIVLECGRVVTMIPFGQRKA